MALGLPLVRPVPSSVPGSSLHLDRADPVPSATSLPELALQRRAPSVLGLGACPWRAPTWSSPATTVALPDLALASCCSSPAPQPSQVLSHGAQPRYLPRPSPSAFLLPWSSHGAWPPLLHLRSRSPSSVGRAPVPAPSSLASVDLLAGGREFISVRARAPLLGPSSFSSSLPRSAVRRGHPIARRADSVGTRPLPIVVCPTSYVLAIASSLSNHVRRRDRDFGMSPCSPSNLGSLLSLHS